MAEPQIVPPPPTINQGEQLPVDTSPGIAQVQNVFDKILPPAKGEPASPPQTQPPSAPDPTQKTESKEPKEQSHQAPPAAEAPPEKKAEERRVPSFLEEALKVEGGEEKPAAKLSGDDEWPEELPTFKNSEEAKERYKKWRQSYDSLKQEKAKLETRPAGDPAAAERLKIVEEQNREMATTLSRLGVEQSVEFQQQVLRPLHAYWNEAARIVKDSGGDPQQLAQAMSLQGKAQFEALDELFADMPESAKAEAHDALRNYRRFENARQQSLANAPKTLEALQKKELQRQYEMVNQQRAEMKNIFDNQLRRLTEEAKLEIFQTSKNPEDKWWNDQAEEIISNSRKLYLENTDMDKMAVACILAPAVDAYRKLWLSERAARMKADGTLKEKFEQEPSLSESPGGKQLPPSQKMAEDLKRPFTEVFLEEFHKSQASSR